MADIVIVQPEPRNVIIARGYGPQGPTGPQGPPGAQGEQGEQGEPGPDDSAIPQTLTAAKTFNPGTFLDKGNHVFNVKAYGAVGDGVTDDKTAILAAFTAAEAAGGRHIVYLPPGRYAVSGTLSLSGYSSVLRGATTGAGNGSVLVATTQTGPVLNLTGWVPPSSNQGVMEFSNFAIEGDNTTDATLASSGIKTSATTALSSIAFRNIGISKTGGPCLDLGPVYLSEFQSIVCVTPVGAEANDVPYIRALGCNGNRFIGIGLRSTSADSDVGASGAVFIDSDSLGSASHDNLFLGWWFEFLHPGTNATVFNLQANTSTISDFQFFDCSKESGATGTSYIRLKPPSAGNASGANTIRGLIPGRGTSGTAIDTGIDVQQSKNRIEGTKGYRGYNVTIASGVEDTYVHLGGAESGASDPAVVDNSGVATNTYIDAYLALRYERGITVAQGSATPEGAVTAGVGSIYKRTGGGAGTTFYIKESGSGNTGWVAVSAPVPPDIQLFTASGTWTKPTNAKTVYVAAISGGAGGGSGRRGASGTVCGGGGGGGGGGYFQRTFDASELSATETVTIGTGGAGGAAQTTNDTNGNAGSAGVTTSFGTKLFSSPGNTGSGGTTSGGAGGASVLGAGATGAGGGAAGGTGAAGGACNPSALGAGSGGGGGGISATPAAFAGGNGGGTYWGRTTANGVGGVVDSTSPTAGTASATKGAPGPGAGGGAASITTAAQAGANATNYGGGGGGGGASLNGNNSGAGGNGGPGVCLVITYFN